MNLDLLDQLEGRNEDSLSSFERSNGRNHTFRGIDIENVEIGNASWFSITFEGCRFREVKILEAEFYNVRLLDCLLISCRIQVQEARDVIFSRCTLENQTIDLDGYAPNLEDRVLKNNCWFIDLSKETKPLGESNSEEGSKPIEKQSREALSPILSSTERKASRFDFLSQPKES